MSFTFFAQAKVCYPDEAICIHQQIIQLQISGKHTQLGKQRLNYTTRF